MEINLRKNGSLYEVKLSEEYQRLYEEGKNMYAADRFIMGTVDLSEGMNIRRDYLTLEMLPKRLTNLTGDRIGALINYFVFRDKTLEDIFINLNWKSQRQALKTST